MFLPCLKAITLVLAVWVLSGETRELRVCADPDNLPYSHTDETGFENRIARLVADELKAELVYAWHPQQRAFVRKTIGAKLCDVWMGVPSEFERVLTTKPYYRSTYVFVYAPSRPLTSFDDPELTRLRIGVQLPGDDLAATPPGHALVLRGAVRNVVGFSVYGDRPAAERIADAIARGELQAAVVWGPQAGYFAARKHLGIAAATPPAGLEKMPFQFSISMGVRNADRALRDELDGAIVRRKSEIDAILAEFSVPRLP
jgi:mxaJ protein